jgi:HEAT repeat protein
VLARCSWRLVAGILVVLGPGAAEARAGRGKAAGKVARPAGEASPQLVAELASDKDPTAAAAARRLGELGGAASADALASALALGVRPAVAVEALGALGKIRDPRSLPVVSLAVGNSNVPVRVAAVKTLGRMADARGVELLLDRLGDQAPPVRAAAAEALAARKETRAEKRLFMLVTRNDAGAAGPLGAVMSPDSIPRLAELHGRIDDAVLSSSLGEFIKRPEVPDRLRLDVVRTLAQLDGAASTAALVEYLASVPDRDTRPSKEEAQKVLDRRGVK